MNKNRNIVACIIFTIITCGLYGIYWFITMSDDAARLNEDLNFSGVKAFIFTIITCGIYGIYWYYKMGKEISEAGPKRGVQVSDNSIVYLILGIFGFGIISYCLITIPPVYNYWELRMLIFALLLPVLTVFASFKSFKKSITSKVSTFLISSINTKSPFLYYQKNNI